MPPPSWSHPEGDLSYKSDIPVFKDLSQSPHFWDVSPKTSPQQRHGQLFAVPVGSVWGIEGGYVAPGLTWRQKKAFGGDGWVPARPIHCTHVLRETLCPSNHLSLLPSQELRGTAVPSTPSPVFLHYFLPFALLFVFKQGQNGWCFGCPHYIYNAFIRLK